MAQSQYKILLPLPIENVICAHQASSSPIVVHDIVSVSNEYQLWIKIIQHWSGDQVSWRKMLKNEVVQNWSEPKRQERARQNDPVAMNDTQIRCHMEEILQFEFAQ